MPQRSAAWGRVLGWIGVFAAAVAHAQDCAQWSPRSTFGPGARAAHTMAYDAARGRAVLFGGYREASANQEAMGDTWLWNGTDWEPANATIAPSKRFYSAMVYDSARQRVVLFGGAVNAPTRLDMLGDTWEWDGRTWTQRSTGGPPARYLHAMAYDAARQRVVLFGGLTVNGPRDQDTWEWDGATWTRVTRVGPPFRYAHALAYDEIHHTTVLFGGYGTPEPSKDYLQDTWEWNGTTWTRTAVTGPAARFHHSMTFNAKRGRIMLLGGRRANVRFADAWEWNGSAWDEVSNLATLGRDSADIVFDSRRGRAVLFGGFTAQTRFLYDTWEQDITDAPEITRQPSDQPGQPGATVVLHVDVNGAEPLYFQWRRFGSPIPANLPRFLGVNGPTLAIRGYQSGDAGVYDVVVTNSCGEVASRSAVVGGAACPADVDDGTGTGARDGGVTVEDFVFYMNAFASGSLAADVDDGSFTGTLDGAVTVEDIVFFISRYASGC